MDKGEQAKAEGRDAHRAGQGIGSNPYPAGSILNRLWLQGYAESMVHEFEHGSK